MEKRDVQATQAINTDTMLIQIKGAISESTAEIKNKIPGLFTLVFVCLILSSIVGNAFKSEISDVNKGIAELKNLLTDTRRELVDVKRELTEAKRDLAQVMSQTNPDNQPKKKK